jgi:hypothetical protein
MKLTYEVTSILEVEYNEKKDSMKHIASYYNLNVDHPLDLQSYLDKDGAPNKEGCQCVTTVLVQALIGNIHACNQMGYMNDAEHLRYIISELERGFIENVNVGVVDK